MMVARWWCCRGESSVWCDGSYRGGVEERKIWCFGYWVFLGFESSTVVVVVVGGPIEVLNGDCLGCSIVVVGG